MNGFNGWSFVERDSTSVLFPIITLRHEEYEHSTKDSFFVLPFWQAWQRHDAEEGETSWRRLWPLYQVDEPVEGHRRVAFPSLNPLWRTEEIEDMYAWLWELFARETQPGIVRERSWLGLYRHEKDADEDRMSFAFLWGKRDWHDAQDRKVTDHSLLLGLIRWRTREDGMFQGLPPAMPGPGWPLERTPRKKAP